MSVDRSIFNALFATIPESLLLVEDAQTQRIIDFSPAAAALLGYPSGESFPSEQILTRGEPVPAAGEPELEGSGVRRESCRLRRSDGSEIEAQAMISPLSLEGCCLTVIGFRPIPRNGDASVSSQATPQPVPSSGNAGQTIRQLLRNLANYAVFTTDGAGAIREWSPEAQRLLGYDGAEVFGKNIAVFCAADAAGALQKAFDEARERGSSRYYQWLTRKDGGRLFARMATFALWSDTAGPSFLFLLRDDSREPSLRQILQEKEQMAAIGTAASILAHEIGNPLNGISATVQLLEHCLRRPTPPGPEMLQSSVQDLKGEVKRLNELLSSFKSIAWPVKLALAPVDLRRLIGSLLQQIEKRSARQNVEVTFHCETQLPPLTGDDDKLKEALLQVLENALDAMPHGGRLEIKAYSREQTLCIDVIDTGVGIPKNLKVFDLFSSTKPEGIGLGLFMVQQIVLAHGGAITYSSAPGQGTTFHVSFGFSPGPESVGADFFDTI